MMTATLAKQEAVHPAMWQKRDGPKGADRDESKEGEETICRGKDRSANVRLLGNTNGLLKLCENGDTDIHL